MIINSNISLVVYHPKTKEFHYVQTNDYIYLNTLKQYQLDWYNIYSILNDFLDKRTEDDLIWFNWIWIDIDSNSYTLESLLKLCEEKLWFFPATINKTYKGFHLFFLFDLSLYFMDKSCYKDIFKLINNALKGDPAMKDITGILKEPGFFDKKDWREDFIITNLYSQENIILKEQVNHLYWKEVLIDTERKKKLNWKIDKKEKRNYLLDEIDVKILIEKINDEVDKKSPLFETKIIIHDNNKIDESDGMILVEKDWKWIINEYNHSETGKRYGNYGFLLNYVLKEKSKHGLIDWKELNKFLHFNFWLSLNWMYNWAKIPFPSFIHLTMKNNSFIVRDITDKEVIKDMYEINAIKESINGKIYNSSYKKEIGAILLTIQKLKFEKKIEWNQEINISEEDFMWILWYKHDNTELNKRIRKLLFMLSYMKISVPYESIVDGELIKWFQFVDYITFWIWTAQNYTNKTWFYIKENINFEKKLWIPDSINDFKKLSQRYFATFLISELEFFHANEKTYNIKLFYDELETASLWTVQDFLKSLKNKNIIFDYKITKKEFITIYKKSPILLENKKVTPWLEITPWTIQDGKFISKKYTKTKNN